MGNQQSEPSQNNYQNNYQNYNHHIQTNYLQNKLNQQHNQQHNQQRPIQQQRPTHQNPIQQQTNFQNQPYHKMKNTQNHFNPSNKSTFQQFNHNQLIQNQNFNQQLNVMNVNDRIQQFQQRELTEEEQFQKAQEKLREVFRKKQEERRRRFYAEIESFEKGQENPYHILGITMDIDQPTLKRAYKKMAIQYHPDKGGNPDIFKKITQAYIYVLDKLEKSKKMSRTFEEAKEEFEKPNDAYIDKRVEETVKKFKLDKDNFNINKFNELFNEFRINDPNDKGYGNGWDEDHEIETQPVFNQKFNKDVFNQVFDETNQKRFKQYSGKNTIIKYQEPQAQLSLQSSGLGFAEIGVDDILNFTGNSGNLNFTDYKAAYTYESTIEKPEMNRKNYKNVKELEADRETISYQMSPEEIARQQAITDYNNKLEEQRRINMERYDQRVQDQYRRIHSNLITN